MSGNLELTNTENPLGGRYQVISELGAGGFGQTFLASDLHLPGQPLCVVKQLKPQTCDLTSLAMARRLFDTEARVLYQLGDHNQIPRLLAHFEENQEFYLAQEFIEGAPLTQELVSGQPWSEAQVLTLLQDILQVLAFVHQQQVIHRDLKPPNLIRRRDGRIVLIDFGAVKQVSAATVNADGEPTNVTISIGTKGYMPNEQLAGSPRYSSDVYAVGVLGIQALTGIPPKRLDKDPETDELDWRSHAPEVSPELADILDKMVCFDFRDRYQTAAEVLEALQPVLLESLPPIVAPPTIVAKTWEAEVPATQALPADAAESVHSEVNLAPTNSFEPTKLPVQTSNLASGISQELSPPAPTLHPSESVPASKILKFLQKWLLKPWSFLAILGTVSTNFVALKTVLSPQSVSPTAEPTQGPASPSIPSPQPQAAEFNQAERLRQAGQYQQALQLYDRVIARKPNMAQAYWGRCYSLNQLQQPGAAIVACNDALNLKDNYPEALWSKGNALYQQKLPIEALPLYEQATRIKPDLAEAWLDRGVALQSVGRSVEAIAALDKAIALKRNSATAWSTRGAALWNLGRFNEAIESLDKALQIQPNNREALRLRVLARRQLGR